MEGTGEGFKIFEGGYRTEKIHPDFKGKIIYDQSGKSFERDYGPDCVCGPYYLDEFRVNNYVSNKEKTVSELISVVEPKSKDLMRFFDVGAISDINIDEFFLTAQSTNADIGTQKRIDLMAGKDVIDSNTFVILTHGHVVAGLTELARLEDNNGKHMFDTTLYFPRTGWSSSEPRARDVVSRDLQLWGETLSEIKRNTSEGDYGKGIAVGLYGHRDDLDLTTFKTNLIDAENLFGTIDDFKDFLESRGLDRVVIITEEADIDPNQVTELPLSRLNEGSFGNKDLFDYFSKLKLSGMDVKVVSGNERPPINQGSKKRLEELKNSNPKVF